MKLTTNYTTLTYEDSGFIINVIVNERTHSFEAWIRHVNYGKAMHMFSVSMAEHTITEFVDMVENLLPAAMEEYAIEYMGV